MPPASPFERTAMLFCPPLPPVRLATGATTDIGRQPSCALALRRDDVSRRHAEIRHEGGGYVLYDLGSTNGTFVNGSPVEGKGKGHRLKPGDRIEIGSAAITFCEIESGVSRQWEEGDGAATIIVDRPQAARQSFGGDLSEVPTDALFQLIEMGSNTGVLEISSSDGETRIYFEMGQPVHACSEKHLGFDAAIRATGLDRGRFCFGPHAETVERTIEASVTELLLEACRQRDEEARG